MGAEQSRERDGLPPLEAQSPNVVHGGQMQTQHILQALARLEAEAVAVRDYNRAARVSAALDNIKALQAKVQEADAKELSLANARDYAGAGRAQQEKSAAEAKLRAGEESVRAEFNLMPMATPTAMPTAVPVGARPAAEAVVLARAQPTAVLGARPVHPTVAHTVGAAPTAPVAAAAPVPQAATATLNGEVVVALASGGWEAGLCDWYDQCGLCCAALCCPFVVVSQLRTRLNPRKSCAALALFLLVGYVVAGVLYFYALANPTVGGEWYTYQGSCFYDQSDCDSNCYTLIGRCNDCTGFGYHPECDGANENGCYDDSPWQCIETISGGAWEYVPIAGYTLLSVMSLIILCCTCNARAAIRRIHHLPGEECGVEDCCVVWCCTPCSMVQMLRQLGVNDGNYNLCSQTGTGEAREDANSLREQLNVSV